MEVTAVMLSDVIELVPQEQFVLPLSDVLQVLHSTLTGKLVIGKPRSTIVTNFPS